MLKNFTFLATLFLSVLYAQVEISNKNKPEIDNATDGIYVNFSDKGVLLPRISLNSLTELKNSSGVNFPKQGDASQMIVYNTNRALGEGFHFWDGSKWRALLDFENVIAQLNSSVMYSANANGIDIGSDKSYVQGNETTLPNYTFNQSGTIATNRNFIPLNISKIVRTNKPNNKVSFTFTGIAQIQQSNSLLTFAIGVFVDGQLKYVENYTGNFTSNSCGFVPVDLDGIILNLSTTQDHTIDVRIHPRRSYDLSTPATTYAYTFGKSIGTCTNLPSEVMKSRLILTVKE